MYYLTFLFNNEIITYAFFDVNTFILNNCFANAKKEFLSKIKEKWNDFLIYESNANKKIMSFIMDTDIVASSDHYAILLNKNSSTSSLINENIKFLEQDFKIFYGMDYTFVCLDETQWDNFKEKYYMRAFRNFKLVLRTINFNT